jgi:hypothetical protein
MAIEKFRLHEGVEHRRANELLDPAEALHLCNGQPHSGHFIESDRMRAIKIVGGAVLFAFEVPRRRAISS